MQIWCYVSFAHFAIEEIVEELTNAFRPGYCGYRRLLDHRV